MYGWQFLVSHKLEFIVDINVKTRTGTSIKTDQENMRRTNIDRYHCLKALTIHFIGVICIYRQSPLYCVMCTLWFNTCVTNTEPLAFTYCYTWHLCYQQVAFFICFNVNSLKDNILFLFHSYLSFHWTVTLLYYYYHLFFQWPLLRFSLCLSILQMAGTFSLQISV